LRNVPGFAKVWKLPSVSLDMLLGFVLCWYKDK